MVHSRVQSGQPHSFDVALFAATSSLQSGLFRFAPHHEGLFVLWMEVCTSFLASTMRSVRDFGERAKLRHSKIPKETTMRTKHKSPSAERGAKKESLNLPNIASKRPKKNNTETTEEPEETSLGTSLHGSLRLSFSRSLWFWESLSGDFSDRS